MDNETNKVPLIDVDKVIRNSKSKLLKMMPQFLINKIKKMLYQDEMNNIIINNKDLYGTDFARCILKEIGLTYKPFGIENIPKDGRFIFVANHPLGGVDGIAVICALNDLYGEDVKTVANDLLMNIDNLKPVFIGVNKHGASSRESVKKFDDAFASDTQLFIFPAGLISRKINGKIVDLEWKKTFLTKAIKHKRDIIPVYINGKVSNRFYRLANIRKKLRMKTNIEMFYIPGEQFRLKEKELVVTFGKPIDYKTFDKSKSLNYWISYIREKVYALAH